MIGLDWDAFIEQHGKRAYPIFLGAMSALTVVNYVISSRLAITLLILAVVCAVWGIPLVVVTRLHGQRGLRRTLRIWWGLSGVLREHGWDSARTWGACAHPGRVSVLVRLPRRLTAATEKSSMTEVRRALRLYDVAFRPCSRPGWGWIDVWFTDPLGDVRTWQLPASPTTSIEVGRTRELTPAVIPLKGRLNIVAQAATNGGKSNLMRILILGALQCGWRVSGSDISSQLLWPLADRGVALGTRDLAAHVAVLDAAVAAMDSALEQWPPRQLNTLIVVEEVPGLLAALAADDQLHARRGVDRLGPRAVSALSRLILEGGKTSTVTAMTAQRFGADLLGSGMTRGSVHGKVSGCGDQQSLDMLHGPHVAEQLDVDMPHLPAGRCVFDMPNEPPRIVALDLLDEDVYIQAVRDLLDRQ